MAQDDADQSEQDDAEEKFTLELGPSEIYGLQTILNHACVEMESYQYNILAEHLSKEVNEVIASENFTGSLNSEMEEIEDGLESVPTDPSEFTNSGGAFQ